MRTEVPIWIVIVFSPLAGYGFVRILQEIVQGHICR